MATWGQLTAEQRQTFGAWLTQTRAVAGELARTLYRLDVVKAGYANGPDDVLAALDAGAVIPNESGLAGAVPVTKTQLTGILSTLNALLTTYYDEADQELYVALAGIENVLRG